MLDPSQTRVALYYRTGAQRWGYPDGHIRQGSVSLFTAARSMAANKLSLNETQLAPLSTRPVYLHQDPQGQRTGGQQPHPHLVVSFLFQAGSKEISPRHQEESIAWLTPDEIAARLGDKHPTAGLTATLKAKLG